MRPLRALDAIHLATFVLARRRLQALELLTADERLAEAALGVGSTWPSRRSS
jgi:predicted nucleic acid-binding protein